MRAPTLAVLAFFLGVFLGTASEAQQMTVSATSTVQMPVTTVGGLPSCSSSLQGAFYFVTDALTPVALATVAAGGAIKVPVVCNGTAWIVG